MPANDFFICASSGNRTEACLYCFLMNNFAQQPNRFPLHPNILSFKSPPIIMISLEYIVLFLLLGTTHAQHQKMIKETTKKY